MIHRSSSEPDLTRNNNMLSFYEHSESEQLYGPWEDISEHSDLSEEKNQRHSSVVLNKE